VLPPEDSYSTYFNTLNDLQVSGLTLQHFSGDPQRRRSLQTIHNYQTNQVYELLIRTPVTVSSTMPVLFYRDIGIVEPDNDSIMVEATKNGLDWISLKSGYDANFSGDESKAWKNAFMNQRSGTTGMFIKHEVDFGNMFAAGDLLLFRFRLISGPEVVSWGWALDYVSIQELPLGKENPDPAASSLALYPNPSSGKVTLDYMLTAASEISVRVVDVYGRSSSDIVTGSRQAGFNSEALDLSALQPGTYMILLGTDEGRLVTKFVIDR
jgi:hypothetical protein